MNVIFVEPSFPYNQREFVRGLHAAGANVIGIGERPQQYLDSQVKDWLSAYWEVPSVVHYPSMLQAVKEIQSKVWVDRLEAVVEAHIDTAARVREACGIPGTSVKTAYLCRDKPAMKEALRAAGVPCAQSMRGTDPAEVIEFAKEVGFPLIIKPIAGAGAADTSRVNSMDELKAAMAQSHLSPDRPAAIEEFIEGHEGFVDTLCINGEVAFEFVTHYYPNVLEAMRTRWISPQMVATNRLNEPGYDEVKAMSRKVIEALEIGTSATHMEWFFGPKGLKFSEIGCRPPGVGHWDVHNCGNDMDLYRAWGTAVTHGAVDQQPSRRFASGLIALRPTEDGVIYDYRGVEAMHRRFGDCIVATHFPPPGTPTQPVAGGYMANAWVRARHPDYDGLREVLDTIGQTVKVLAR